MTTANWPVLPGAEWAGTYSTVHMWTQMVGKIRTVQMPWTNHGWHTTLYVTPQGLTTLAMPHGGRSFQIDFNFVQHRLDISASDGGSQSFDLSAMSVKDFHGKLMSALDSMDLAVAIHGRPNEVDPNPPFAEDTEHASYDADAMARIHQSFVHADRVMKQFRAGFRGKCSPVHFFWGSFDMAVTRFSGRTAPQHPGGFPNMPDWITREAYSHDVSSCGFWPGNGEQNAFFYAYAYPTPDGFSGQPVRPAAGTYSQDLGEFVLPYSAVQQSATPDEDLLAFFQSTYEAAASTANWDRDALEWQGPERG